MSVQLAVESLHLLLCAPSHLQRSACRGCSWEDKPPYARSPRSIIRRLSNIPRVKLSPANMIFLKGFNALQADLRVNHWRLQEACTGPFLSGLSKCWNCSSKLCLQSGCGGNKMWSFRRPPHALKMSPLVKTSRARKTSKHSVNNQMNQVVQDTISLGRWQHRRPTDTPVCSMGPGDFVLGSVHDIHEELKKALIQRCRNCPEAQAGTLLDCEAGQPSQPLPEALFGEGI